MSKHPHNDERQDQAPEHEAQQRSCWFVTGSCHQQNYVHFALQLENTSPPEITTTSSDMTIGTIMGTVLTGDPTNKYTFTSKRKPLASRSVIWLSIPIRPHRQISGSTAPRKRFGVLNMDRLSTKCPKPQHTKYPAGS